MLDKPGIVAVPFVKSEDLASLFSRPADHQTTTQSPSSTTNRFEPDEYQPTSEIRKPLRTTYTEADQFSDTAKPIEAYYRELPPAPGDLERARRAWVAGASSVRKLANVLGATEWQARKLVEQLRGEGLI